MSPMSRFPSLLWLVAACMLGGCAADAPRPSADDESATSSGPTIYGRIGVSVDHIKVN
jgi:hypothetical protein